MTAQKKITVTDTILRDAHQSLIATRMRTEDMLPICDKLDRVGYWSLEVWGGATFDACVRFLKEDPWERLRQLKAARTTELQLLRDTRSRKAEARLAIPQRPEAITPWQLRQRLQWVQWRQGQRQAEHSTILQGLRAGGSLA